MICLMLISLNNLFNIMSLEKMFFYMVARDASDLHLTVGSPLKLELMGT